MDIVYLVKVDPENDSEELRYSLRSLRNIPHNKVIIVGEKPDWVKDVTFIPVAQTKTKPENVTMNLRAAIDSPEVADDFILMNDDFFIMKPIDAMPSLNFGKLDEVIRHYEHRYQEVTPYIESMKRTNVHLSELGIERPLSFELHTPQVLNKAKVIALRSLTNGRPSQFRTAYGNYFMKDSTTVSDVKIFIDSRHNPPGYIENPRDYLAAQTFLSATGGAFKRGLVGDYLREAFPEPSPYERVS
jgi:hypothetical protein